MCSDSFLRCPKTEILADGSIAGQWSGTYEIPSIAVQRCNLGLKVHTRLARHNIVVAKALVPGSIFEDTLIVHVHPSRFKTQNACGSEVYAGVIEVVAHRDLDALYQPFSSLAVLYSLTKALQFFIAQIWPT